MILTLALKPSSSKHVDNFMPESIDSSKPGTIDIQRGSTTSVTVERPTQVGKARFMHQVYYR